MLESSWKKVWILLGSSWKKVLLYSRESTGIPIYPSKIQSYEKKNYRTGTGVYSVVNLRNWVRSESFGDDIGDGI